jgi:GNAT superfamily N-acetyltransferase
MTNRAWPNSELPHVIVNMLVDLARSDFQYEPELPQALAGVVLEKRGGVTDAERAFIETTFGGTWSAEAGAGWNWFARRAGVPVGFCTFEQRAHRFWWLTNWFERTDVGIFGPMGVNKSARGIGLGGALARRALCSLRSLGFAYAIIPAVGPVEFYERCCGARVVERLTGP